MSYCQMIFGHVPREGSQRAQNSAAHTARAEGIRYEAQGDAPAFSLEAVEATSPMHVPPPAIVNFFRAGGPAMRLYGAVYRLCAKLRYRDEKIQYYRNHIAVLRAISCLGRTMIDSWNATDQGRHPGGGDPTERSRAFVSDCDAVTQVVERRDLLYNPFGVLESDREEALQAAAAQVVSCLFADELRSELRGLVDRQERIEQHRETPLFAEDSESHYVLEIQKRLSALMSLAIYEVGQTSHVGTVAAHLLQAVRADDANVVSDLMGYLDAAEKGAKFVSDVAGAVAGHRALELHGQPEQAFDLAKELVGRVVVSLEIDETETIKALRLGSSTKLGELRRRIGRQSGGDVFDSVANNLGRIQLLMSFTTYEASSEAHGRSTLLPSQEMNMVVNSGEALVAVGERYHLMRSGRPTAVGRSGVASMTRHLGSICEASNKVLGSVGACIAILEGFETISVGIAHGATERTYAAAGLNVLSGALLLASCIATAPVGGLVAASVLAGLLAGVVDEPDAEEGAPAKKKMIALLETALRDGGTAASMGITRGTLEQLLYLTRGTDSQGGPMTESWTFWEPDGRWMNPQTQEDFIQNMQRRLRDGGFSEDEARAFTRGRAVPGLAD